MFSHIATKVRETAEAMSERAMKERILAVIRSRGEQCGCQLGIFIDQEDEVACRLARELVNEGLLVSRTKKTYTRTHPISEALIFSLPDTP